MINSTKDIKIGDLLKLVAKKDDDKFSYTVEKTGNYFYPLLADEGTKIENGPVLFLGIEYDKSCSYLKIFVENTIVLVIIDNDYHNMQYFEKIEV